jgi:hypothetical protein
VILISAGREQKNGIKMALMSHLLLDVSSITVLFFSGTQVQRVGQLLSKPVSET